MSCPRRGSPPSPMRKKHEKYTTLFALAQNGMTQPTAS